MKFLLCLAAAFVLAGLAALVCSLRKAAQDMNDDDRVKRL